MANAQGLGPSDLNEGMRHGALPGLWPPFAETQKPKSCKGAGGESIWACVIPEAGGCLLGVSALGVGNSRNQVTIRSRKTRKLESMLLPDIKQSVLYLTPFPGKEFQVP